MHRREFFTKTLAGLSVVKLNVALAQPPSSGPFIERARPGQPHKGKVLAAIQPHSDDIALLCAGTVAKLIQEGYTGYMIRATNDDMGDDVGEPGTVGENVLRNEREVAEQARALGLQRDFALNYNNHRMSDISRNELICRLIFSDSLSEGGYRVLLRSVGARRGESRPLRAGSLRGGGVLDGGTRARLSGAVRGGTHGARRQRQILLRASSGHHARGGYQRHRSKRRSTRTFAMWPRGRAAITAPGCAPNWRSKAKKLPLLGDDDRTADRNYIREFVLAHGIAHWGKNTASSMPRLSTTSGRRRIGGSGSRLDDYVKQNAVPLGIGRDGATAAQARACSTRP